VSDEEYEKLPRLSKEDIEEMWAKVRENWRKAMSAPTRRRRIKGRYR
jgi:hypothetical protein